MAKSTAGPEIERLIQLLARLPGLGPRSARRAALHLIKKREPLMAPLAAALQTAIEKIEVCRTCGNIDRCHSARQVNRFRHRHREPRELLLVEELRESRKLIGRGIAERARMKGHSIAAEILGLHRAPCIVHRHIRR